MLYSLTNESNTYTEGPPTSTQAVDIDTDPCCGRTKDPDMVLSSSIDLDSTMDSGGITGLSESPALRLFTVQTASFSPPHICSLQWHPWPWTVPVPSGCPLPQPMPAWQWVRLVLVLFYSDFCCILLALWEVWKRLFLKGATQDWYTRE